MRDMLLPARLAGPNVSSAEPNMSGGKVSDSIALMKLSVVRFVPAFSAAWMKVSIAE